MGRPATEDPAFALTWQQLGLPAELAQPLDATITPRTFALARAASAAGPPVAMTESVRRLPHISVHEPRTPDPSTDAPVGPDLVVLGLLGEGGMGRVQLARQRSLEREVALKRPRLDASAQDAEVLRQEALVTGHLEHPNIVPVHAVGRDDAEQPLIVMKRVEGVAWRDLLHDAHHPGWATREPDRDARATWHLQILVQVSNAIAFAHSRGIVHRDVKPENVMIGEFGEVYLLDWGLAARLADGARPQAGLVGTPAYMAPEMVRGEGFDERTDVYLLGATLHEVLTRTVRHPGGDLESVLRQAFFSNPLAYGPEVPEELAALANRATARDPADRPPTALAFRDAVIEYLRHRGSMSLCDAADARLAEAETVVGDPTLDATVAQRVDRTLHEARFGYREALRQWPENRGATAGLERCGVAAVRLQLRLRNPVAARAALDELTDPPGELADAVVRLEGQLDAERTEREHLRELARDVDPTLGARSRTWTISALIGFLVLLSVYATKLKADRPLDGVDLVRFAIVIHVATWASALTFRRTLLVNAFNRRLVTWLLGISFMMLVGRTVGLALDTPVPRQYVNDLILLTGMLMAGAIFLFRWFWISVAVSGVGVLIAVLYVRYAFFVFVWVGLAAIVIALLGMTRIARPRDAPDD